MGNEEEVGVDEGVVVVTEFGGWAFGIPGNPTTRTRSAATIMAAATMPAKKVVFISLFSRD